MHAVPSPTTKVVTPRCQQNILCKSTPPLTIQLCKSTPPFTFLIWLNMTMMHGHTSKDRIMQNSNIYIYQQQCKSTPPFTLINFHNNCIIKYLRPHNQSSHNSIKSHHHIIIIIINKHQHHHHRTYQQTSTSLSS
jgi:hypothetical protein